jgi:hypothetical protein
MDDMADVGLSSPECEAIYSDPETARDLPFGTNNETCVEAIQLRTLSEHRHGQPAWGFCRS